ncbi:5-hydroxytryptamine receptor 2A [Ooceraea biroi]|uniref:5-hydroxytryptamine receptor 2A n=1 Tax=Ooceraea biroi TaxID=2015173 RepID=A0A026VXN3_OOCBI|nr:5-hydroxytryptamine receptor 2A [Ooceraea biroi]
MYGALVTGNLFVMAAIILERNLQSVANYLILSLAVADLMVACLVMPLGAVYEELRLLRIHFSLALARRALSSCSMIDNSINSGWSLGPALCDIWTSFDVLCCTASILHLVAIAVDRYWAVTDINYIQVRNSKRISMLIAAVWVVSLGISIAPHLGWKDPDYLDRIAEGTCLVSQDTAYQENATGNYSRELENRLHEKAFPAPFFSHRVNEGASSGSSREGSPFCSVFHSLNILSAQYFISSGLGCYKSFYHDVWVVQDIATRQREHKYTSLTAYLLSNIASAIPCRRSFIKILNIGVVISAASIIPAITSWRQNQLLSLFPNQNNSDLFGRRPREESTAFTITRSTPDHSSISPEKSSSYNGANVTPSATVTPTAVSTTTTTTTLTNPTSTSQQQQIVKCTRHTRETIESKRERKAAKTLVIITGAFVACWLPFFLAALTQAICQTCKPPELVASVFLWLGYFNSTLNPLIYTVFSPEFRQAFKRMLCGGTRGLR